MIELPRQWLYWCAKAGLKPSLRSINRKRAGFNLKGHGRRWRVNINGVLQVSCKIAEFDRWANSVEAELPHIPQTEAAFLSAIDQLLKRVNTNGN